MKLRIPVEKNRWKPNLYRFLVVGFFLIILLGATLLALPIASKDGTWTSFSDTLFTATSATCITGLVVVDTATHWSFFGQAVILTMIQIGGLGFMTLGSALVRLRNNGKLYSGNGTSTDIIAASIRAYINALNKIVFEEA